MDFKEQFEDFVENAKEAIVPQFDYLKERFGETIGSDRLKLLAVCLLVLLLFLIFLFLFSASPKQGVQLRIEGAEGAVVSLIGEDGAAVAESAVSNGIASFENIENKRYDYVVKVNGEEIGGIYDPEKPETINVSQPTENPSSVPQETTPSPTPAPTITSLPSSEPTPAPTTEPESNQTLSNETTREVSVCLSESFMEKENNYTLKDITISSATFEVFSEEEMVCSSYSSGCTFSLNSTNEENKRLFSVTGVSVVLNKIEGPCAELEVTAKD